MECVNKKLYFLLIAYFIVSCSLTIYAMQSSFTQTVYDDDGLSDLKEDDCPICLNGSASFDNNLSRQFNCLDEQGDGVDHGALIHRHCPETAWRDNVENIVICPLCRRERVGEMPSFVKLYAAVCSNDIGRVCNLLSRGGIDLNFLHHNYNQTLLTQALMLGHDNMVEALLSALVGINGRNRCGELPLYVAVKMCRIDMIQYILSKCQPHDVNARSNGKTALHVAAQSGNLMLVKLLLEHGADINSKDDQGRKAWYYAHNHGHPEIAKFLKKEKHCGCFPCVVQ